MLLHESDSLRVEIGSQSQTEVELILDSPSGWLDVENIPEFRNALQGMVKQGHMRIVLNMQSIPGIGADFFRAIIEFLRANRNITIVFRRVTESARRALSLCAFERFTEIEDNTIRRPV